MILTIRLSEPAGREVRSRQGRTSACVGCRSDGRPGVHGWTPAAKAGQARERGGLRRPSRVGLGTSVSRRLP